MRQFYDMFAVFKKKLIKKNSVTNRSSGNDKSDSFIGGNELPEDELEKLRVENQELRESAEYYKSIVSNSVEGIFQTTPDGKYILANQALAEIYGYNSAEDMIHSLKSISQQLYKKPLRRDEFMYQIREKGKVVNFESEVYRADGKAIWIKENARAIYDKDGGVLYYEGAVQDITDRVKSAERLMETNMIFSKFVPKQIFQTLKIEDLSYFDIERSEDVEMSILFIDIRSFTSLAEQMNPEETLKFLNSYFARITRIVESEFGFVDKYLGDGMLVVFPKSRDAVRCAFSIRIDLVDYNAGRNRAGYDSIKVGIGINTGKVVIGFIGGHSRCQGTVIGDTVNVASRIEGLTKEAPSNFIIGEKTYSSLDQSEKAKFEFYLNIAVKGRMKSINLYRAV